jgi:hypothetical protein
VGRTGAAVMTARDYLAAYHQDSSHGRVGARVTKATACFTQGGMHEQNVVPSRHHPEITPGAPQGNRGLSKASKHCDIESMLLSRASFILLNNETVSHEYSESQLEVNMI